MRLEPVTGKATTVVCIRCDKNFVAGSEPLILAFNLGAMMPPVVVYLDVESGSQEYYCRQCADEMGCFPPYRKGRTATGPF
jgi:hypothetical protein